MSSYTRTIDKLNEATGSRQPCKRCETPTLVATLSQYGARCYRCFQDFGAAAFSPSPPTYDTVQQAEMRKRLRTWSPAPNVLNRAAEADPEARDRAKAETNRRVADYARKYGLSLEQSEAIHHREGHWA